MKYVGLYDNNKDIVTKDKLDAVEAAIPTKVSELTNDANYITAAQAPVQSVNGKTGAVSLTASDVSAIPSTLTGTAGQVLTKTAEGQEWKDVASPKAIKITLSVADWNTTAKTQSVTVPGVLSDATKQEIRVMPVNAALDSPYIAAGVQCVAQAANSLTFACETVPTEAIEVYVVMQDINYLFSATITVHVKSGVYVTLLKGSTTIDSKESTGTAVFTVMETGTYRIIVSTESSSMSNQVNVISGRTAYDVFFDNFG